MLKKKNYIAKKEDNTIISSFLFALICSTFYFSIDYLNILKNHLKLKFDEKFLIILIMIAIVWFILFIFYKDLYKALIDYNKTFLEKIIFFCFFFFLFITISNIFYDHYCIASGLLFIFFSILLIILLCFGTDLTKDCKEEDKKISTIKLKQLKNNQINEANLLLIEDREIVNINDDLLNLTHVKKNLINFIMNCHPEHSFVVGLIGEWGIGKTSTIKLVEKELSKEKVKMSFFNPWIYNNNYDLMEGFCSMIYSMLDFNYMAQNSFNTYTKMILKIIDEKIGVDLFSNQNLNHDLEQKKEIINKYIITSNDKLILVIDNLDRINKEQLSFFFNTITNLLNFDRLLFILCYDEKIIHEIMCKDNNFDESYIDKIINSKIYMPFIDNTMIYEIAKDCFLNLLSFYNIDISEELGFNEVLKIISYDIHTLRNLTRFLNTISLNLNGAIENNLYIPDFIALEYIQFAYNDYYKYIYNHPTHLCYGNPKLDDEEFNKYNKNSTINALNNFLFNFNSKLFKYPILNINKKNRCNDYNIFPTYFVQKPTKTLILSLEINNIIKDINESKNISNNKLKDLCNTYTEVEVISNLKEKLNSIKKPEKILTLIFSSKPNFKYSDELYVLIQNLYIKVTKKNDCLQKISRDNEILFLLFINKYMENSENSINNEKSLKKSYAIIEQAATRMIKNNTMIFNENNYYPNLMRILIKYANCSKEQIKMYIAKQMNTKNVYKILGNFVINTIPHCYIFDFHNYGQYLNNKKVKNFLKNPKNHLSINDDQIRICDLYMSSKELIYESDINFYNL